MDIFDMYLYTSALYSSLWILIYLNVETYMMVHMDIDIICVSCIIAESIMTAINSTHVGTCQDIYSIK
jgi:hypothetical protein